MTSPLPVSLVLPGIRVAVPLGSYPAQQAIRQRAYQTLDSQYKDLSTHKKDSLRFLAALSQQPYGARVALGTWTADQLDALTSKWTERRRRTCCVTSTAL